MDRLDARQRAPATSRNRDVILEVLKTWLPQEGGSVLEIAAGTGEHGVYFTPRLPQVHWLSTDVDDDRVHSIKAWQKAEPCERYLNPCQLDVTQTIWTVEEADITPPINAVFCANMIHIAPISALHGLLKGAGRILPSSGRLILYGPFKTQYGHTSQSNADFDESLKARNPEWGIRALDMVVEHALDEGLIHRKTISMPANNLSLVFEAA